MPTLPPYKTTRPIPPTFPFQPSLTTSLAIMAESLQPIIQHEEKLVKKMFYDPTHPIDVIFNKVEDLLLTSQSQHKLTSWSSN